MLLSVLDERYDLIGHDYIIKGKLRRTVQRNNQSLQTFADSIMRVTLSSYGEHGATMALEQFIQGLADTRMQKYVTKRQPKTCPTHCLLLGNLNKLVAGCKPRTGPAFASHRGSMARSSQRTIGNGGVHGAV